MAKQNRKILKGYFDTGDIPTQGQYRDLIDSKLNLADTGIQIVPGTVSASFLEVENHITASGNISGSSTSTLTIGSTLTAGAGILTSITSTGNSVLGNAVTDTHVFTGHITASGNISASGTIFASKFESAGTAGETIIFNDNLRVTGSITASSNISASGKVEASGFTINGVAVGTSTDTFWETGSSGKISYNAGNVGIGTLTPGEKLEVVGNISSSGTITADKFTSDGKNAIENSGPAIVVGNQTNFPVKIGRGGTTNIELRGPVTASGNISASGTITANSGSFNHIESINRISHTGDAGTGLRLNPDTVIIEGNNVPIGTFSTTKINLNRPVTASIISASGTIFGNVGTFNNLGHITASGISSSGLITGKGVKVGFNSRLSFAQGSNSLVYNAGALTFEGNDKIIFNPVVVLSSALTASRNISASGNIIGETGSFDNGIILTAPNGNKFRFIVNNSGHLSITGSAV